MHKKKIAYGMICAKVTELSPVTDFFDNARKYGHKIDHLIICYKDYYDDNVIEHLSYCISDICIHPFQEPISLKQVELPLTCQS